MKVERLDPPDDDFGSDGNIAVLRLPANLAIPKLSAAEREVAALVAEGLSNAEIAQRRGTAERTVINQVASLFKKLEVGSRSQLVLVLK